MIKVCIVINALAFGGVEKIIENYLFGFDQKKFEITIVAQQGSNREHISFFESLGFKVLIVTHKRKNWFKNAKEINEIIKKGKFDIVHSNMSFTNFYVLRLAKKNNVQVRINHYHNVFEGGWLKLRIIRFFNKESDKYATINFFCSNAVKNFFGNCTRECLVLRNAIDIKRFMYNENDRKAIRSRYGIDDSAFVLGHVGRFVQQKNQKFLIDVFHEFQKNVQNSKLLIVGDGPLINQLRRQIDDYGLNDKVIFAGSFTDASCFYQAMDSFCFPSLFEGLGLTFIEAQISGLNCLGSDILADEAIITNNAKTISLSLPAKEWAKSIYYSNNRTVDLSEKKIQEYNLDCCKGKLLELYVNLVERK